MIGRRFRIRFSDCLLLGGALAWGASCSSTGGMSSSGGVVLSASGGAFLSNSIVQQKQCTTCHSVGETGGTVGPRLDQVGNRRTKEWLTRWLRDPNEVKNETKMPNFQFSNAELTAIVAVLTEMKGDTETEAILANNSLSPVQRGEQIFGAKDCYACHRIGSEGRFVGPNLTWLSIRKSEEWEREWLADPPAYKPDTFMPNFHLSETEVDALASYLHSLQGQKNDEAKRWEGNVIFILDSRPREIGGMVYRRFGCDGCHGQNGQGGYKNINATNEMMPSLITVARNKTKEEVVEIILSGQQTEKLDPSGPDPLSSPAWGGHMTEQEAGYIYEYLLSIAPKRRRFRIGEDL